MASAQGTGPIYFESLTLENVRCFGESQTLSLTDANGNPARWTIILGSNNSGKTTLLQCLAWMRPEPEETPADNQGRKKKGKESRDADSDFEKVVLAPAISGEENEVLESLIRVGDAVTLNLVSSLRQGHRFDSNDLGTELRIGIRIFGEQGKLKGSELTDKHVEELGKYKAQELHVIAYGANRHMGAQNLSGAALEDPIAFRLSTGTELYDAEEILEELDYAAAKKGYSGRAHENLERLKGILVSILPGIKERDDIKILGPKVLGAPDETDEPHGVRFNTFSGLVPLGALSLGYQTTLAWTIDLAYRLFNYYPNSDNPLNEPAVVLIDEIDLHLHPKWQRIIMEHLNVLFPGTQFIVTAHSPLIVQAATDANIVVLKLDGNHIIIDSKPHVVREWRVDQILTSELFDIKSARNPNVEALVNERDLLLDQTSRSPEEEDRLKEIEKLLEVLPTADSEQDQEAMDLIRRAASLLDSTRIPQP